MLLIHPEVSTGVIPVDVIVSPGVHRDLNRRTSSSLNQHLLVQEWIGRSLLRRETISGPSTSTVSFQGVPRGEVGSVRTGFERVEGGSRRGWNVSRCDRRGRNETNGTLPGLTGVSGIKIFSKCP